ncbi:MAG TPA: PepSY-associated TM helix domain-containing protein, partial [Vicinamibacterales bacterium]|nr:PepSY-associated TM helix domain-containing protein [Vicinamibacterales bacterium]
GFWSSSVILVMTLSGIVMAYPWANSLLYHLAGSPVPQQNSQHGNGTAAGRAADQRTPASVKVPRALDAMWARAEETMPTWSAMSVRFSARGPVAFTLTDGAYWNAFARSQLTLDATNADVVRWEPYSETSAGQKARGWIRFAHTGELGGWPLQLAAGLACIGGMFLVWTGWSLAIRRWLSTATTTRRARPSDRKAA